MNVIATFAAAAGGRPSASRHQDERQEARSSPPVEMGGEGDGWSVDASGPAGIKALRCAPVPRDGLRPALTPASRQSGSRAGRRPGRKPPQSYGAWPASARPKGRKGGACLESAPSTSTYGSRTRS
jgi:hypothetical protein